MYIHTNTHTYTKVFKRYLNNGNTINNHRKLKYYVLISYIKFFYVEKIRFLKKTIRITKFIGFGGKILTSTFIEILRKVLFH